MSQLLQDNLSIFYCLRSIGEIKHLEKQKIIQIRQNKKVDFQYYFVGFFNL